MKEATDLTTRKEEMLERRQELPRIVPMVDIFENDDEILEDWKFRVLAACRQKDHAAGRNLVMLNIEESFQFLNPSKLPRLMRNSKKGCLNFIYQKQKLPNPEISRSVQDSSRGCSMGDVSVSCPR
jgi:hypothetical protein